MAEEAGAFAFGDVVEAITAKMIRRHPHVFGDETARDAGAVKGFWERIKAEEKAAKAVEPLPPATGQALLDDVPVALPALTRASSCRTKPRRSASTGRRWRPCSRSCARRSRELEEIALPADPRGDMPDDAEAPATRAKIEEEFGDLLFVVANVARHLELDPEAALRAANQKFVRRFRHIEARLAAAGPSAGAVDARRDGRALGRGEGERSGS